MGKEYNDDSKSSNLCTSGVSQKPEEEAFKIINESVGEPVQRKIVQKYSKQKQDVLSDDDDDDDDDDMYGPALPPHLLKKKGKKSSVSDTRNISGESIQNDYEKQDLESDDDDMYGAALPPHLLNKKQEKSKNSDNRRILGPSLPKGFIPPETPLHINSDKEEKSESEDSDGPIIGPTPSSQKFDKKEYRMQQLELRALKMKEKLEGKDNHDNKPLVRESWMTELPEGKPNFCGLAPRQFLRKTPQAKGDRSVWTDTPADKERKAKMDKEEQHEPTPVSAANKRREDELSEQIDEYNKAKRAKPLIDLHRKKLKEKEDPSGPKERRPFSRELDMNVNKFDEAQKSSILKKARKLNDRFSAGDKKFL
ncbi:GPALPP motifs-containing protein 1-like isoform X2 [Panulirus ornatus]